MISSFDEAGCCKLADSLGLSIRELTVGIYEEIAKSEMHEPGEDWPVRYTRLLCHPRNHTGND